MTIWLHIGLGKTGTKTIQRFLKWNRRELRALGYLYPDPGAGGNAHYNLAYQLLQPKKLRPGRKTWEDIARLTAENPQKTLLLSAETFGAFKAREIAAVRRFLPDADFRMVVYLREQAGLLESWHSQRIKNGAAREDIGTFGAAVMESMTFTRMLEPWRDSLGRDKLSVRVFDRSRFVNGDLIDDFLSSVGLPTQREHSAYVAAIDHNVTPGPKALSLIDVVRGELSAHAAEMGFGSESLRRALTSVLYSSLRQWPTEARARLLSPAQRAAVEQRFAGDNAQVLKEYLNDAHPSLFPVRHTSDEPANLVDSAAIVASLPPMDLVKAMSYALACALQHQANALGKSVASAAQAPDKSDDDSLPGVVEPRLSEDAAPRSALLAERRERRKAARKGLAG